MGDTEGLKPRKKPAQERSREMVAKLQKAATEILIEEGYRKMSTNRIAKRAGVSVGSLYQYFPNKDAIVLALYEGVCERQMSVIAAKLVELEAVEDVPLEDAIRAVLSALLEAWQVDKALSRALLREVTHIEGFHMLRAWLDRICELVGGVLALESDKLRPRDTQLAAFIVVNAVNGILFSAELDRDELITDPDFAHELTELVVRYLKRD